jgi:hypothetical protein
MVLLAPGIAPAILLPEHSLDVTVGGTRATETARRLGRAQVKVTDQEGRIGNDAAFCAGSIPGGDRGGRFDQH